MIYDIITSSKEKFKKLDNFSISMQKNTNINYSALMQDNTFSIYLDVEEMDNYISIRIFDRCNTCYYALASCIEPDKICVRIFDVLKKTINEKEYIKKYKYYATRSRMPIVSRENMAKLVEHVLQLVICFLEEKTKLF